MSDEFWAKPAFPSFYVLLTPSETGCYCNSEGRDTFLAGTSCTRCLDGTIVSVLVLFSVATLGSCFKVFLRSYSRYGVNKVSLGSILSGANLFEMRCTRSLQLVGIVQYTKNGIVGKSLSNTTCNWGDALPVSGFITRSTDTAWNGNSYYTEINNKLKMWNRCVSLYLEITQKGFHIIKTYHSSANRFHTVFTITYIFTCS